MFALGFLKMAMLCYGVDGILLFTLVAALVPDPHDRTVKTALTPTILMIGLLGTICIAISILLYHM